MKSIADYFLPPDNIHGITKQNSEEPKNAVRPKELILSVNMKCEPCTSGIMLLNKTPPLTVSEEFSELIQSKNPPAVCAQIRENFSSGSVISTTDSANSDKDINHCAKNNDEMPSIGRENLEGSSVLDGDSLKFKELILPKDTVYERETKREKRKVTCTSEISDNLPSKRTKISMVIVESDSEKIEEDDDEEDDNRKKASKCVSKKVRSKSVSCKRKVERPSPTEKLRQKTSKKVKALPEARKNNEMSLENNSDIGKSAKDPNDISGRRKLSSNKLKIIITKHDNKKITCKEDSKKEICEMEKVNDLTGIKENCIPSQTVSSVMESPDRKDVDLLSVSVSPEDESKKQNSLFSYFNKVPKESVLNKIEKIKVTAMIHSPTQLCSEGIDNNLSHSKAKSLNSVNRKKKCLSAVSPEMTEKIELVRSEYLSETELTAHIVEDSTSQQKQKNDINPASMDSEVNCTKGSVLSPCKTWRLRIRLRELDTIENKEESNDRDADKHKILFPEAVNGKTNKADTEAENEEDRPMKTQSRLSLRSSRMKSNTRKNSSVEITPHISAQQSSAVNDSNGNLVPKSEKKFTVEDSVHLAPLFLNQKILSPEAVLRKTDKVDSDSKTEENTAITTRRRLSLRSSRTKEKSSTEEIVPDTSAQQSNNSNRTLVSNIGKKLTEEDSVRLAPLFLKKKTKKLKPDSAAIEARRNFLESGFPEALKKVVDLQRIAEENEEEFPPFPKISHVQQKEDRNFVWDLPKTDLQFANAVSDFRVNYCCDESSVRELVDITTKCFKLTCTKPQPFPTSVLCKLVSQIKSEYSDLPVFRTFKNLNKKYLRGRCHISAENKSTGKKKVKRRSSRSKQPVQDNCDEVKSASEQDVMFCEKYRPSGSGEIIGSTHTTRRLKRWLESWKLRCTEVKSSKKKKKTAVSSSDDDFSSSGTNGPCDVNNTVVLLGPHGSGKTCSVYAVANELGFKVLEINASSKRNGKRILADLQEATQSHRIGISESEQAQLALGNFFTKKSKSERRSSHKPKTIEVKKKSRMTLILVEDADIVFEDHDDGFVSALSVIVTTSKRPVIFTATDAQCPHLLRFMNQNSVMKFEVLPTRMLSLWFQLLCLIEGIRVTRSAITNLLEFMKYDIRKALLHLQFWILSGGNNIPSLSNSRNHTVTPYVCSEGPDISNLSWASNSETDLEMPEECSDCLRPFVTFNDTDCAVLKLPFPVDFCGVWWNVPPLLGLPITKIYRHNDNPVTPNENFKPSSKHDDFLYYNSDEETVDGKSEYNSSFHTGNDSAVACNEEKLLNTNSGSEMKLLKDNQSSNLSKCSQSEIDAMAELMDALSCGTLMSSFVGGDQSCLRRNDVNINCWDENPQDSTSLNEVFLSCADMHLASAVHFLTERSIMLCRNALNVTEVDAYNHALPLSEDIRWVSEQHQLSSSVWDLIPQSSWLSHREMATDYCPLIRSMSRLHQNVAVTSTTRHRRRYFHYLKDLGTSADVTKCKAISSILSPR